MPVNSCDAVELRGRADAVDLGRQLADFRLRSPSWSPVASVPFWYCTASSRMRWSIAWTWFSEPSAVCTSETPSCALRCAWSRPLTWPVSFWLIARPAASSAALLMRRPEDRRCIDFASWFSVLTRFRCASNASTLVLIIRPIAHLLDGVGFCLADSVSAFLLGVIARPLPYLRRISVECFGGAA